MKEGFAGLWLVSILFFFQYSPLTRNKEIADLLFQPLIDSKTHVGIVVGVAAENESNVYTYGKSGNPHNQALDGDTLFEIGSITKVFTAVLLAEMVQKQELTLTDPIDLFLPASVKVPRYGDKKITLLDLATHTSGLPVWPLGFKSENDQNPFGEFGMARMYQFLSGYKLRGEIGGKYAYSNLGYGLLGHILSLRAGRSYEALVVERICNPLHMASTRIQLPTEMLARLAQGHSEKGEGVANWDLPAFEGSGGLRSSVHDMQKFLEANLGLMETPLLPTLQATHLAHRRMNLPDTFMGLGWHITNEDGNEILWHSGATGGYTSFIALHKNPPLGVVVLSNSSNAITGVGFQFLAKMTAAGV